MPGQLQNICAEVLKDLAKYRVTLLTTNWVKYESLTRLRRHGIERCRKLQRLLESDLFSVERVSKNLESRSLEIFWTHHDKEWSIVDCSGFELMVERQILFAFAADHHFTQAGRVPLIEQEAGGGWQKSYQYLTFG